MSANTKETFYSAGYTGTAEYSPDDAMWEGQLDDINDLVLFEGESLEETTKNFKDAVAGYIETCEEIGKKPDKPKLN